MSTETKRRLLLSKWRGLRERLEALESELGHAKDQIRSLEDDRDEYAERMERVLHDVKYWMLEPLAHHMPMRDPRVILRKVEDVLG